MRNPLLSKEAQLVASIMEADDEVNEFDCSRPPFRDSITSWVKGDQDDRKKVEMKRPTVIH